MFSPYMHTHRILPLLHLILFYQKTLSGSLTSLQNDATTGKTNWIIRGVYKMNNINTANPMFKATFYMMKTDGSAPHKHTVSDFKISGKPVVANNSTTFNVVHLL